MFQIGDKVTVEYLHGVFTVEQVNDKAVLVRKEAHHFAMWKR